MRVVTFGEIMLRLASPGYQRFVQAESFEVSYGGGEANVAVSLANYGIDVSFVSRFPKNDIGESAVAALRKHNVDVNNIVWGGNRLGIYFLEKGAVNRASKVVYDRAYSAVSEIEPNMIDWDKVFEGTEWFHWTGITPAISQSAADTLKVAIEKANEKGITVSTDLNYRKKLWNYNKSPKDIMPDLVAGCDIVFGNEEDAEMVLGIAPENVDVTSGELTAQDYLSVSKKIIKDYPRVKKVITSLRGSISASHNSWAGTMYNGKELLTSQTYQITHIVDRVGGGDSFMGGLIYGLLTYKNDQKALDFAVAASCLKHTIEGDFNLATVQEVEKLMAGDVSGRVSR